MVEWRFSGIITTSRCLNGDMKNGGGIWAGGLCLSDFNSL